MSDADASEDLRSRVTELEGVVAGLKAALAMAFSQLATYAEQSDDQRLGEQVSSLRRGVVQAGEYYAEIASATVIPDAHIENAQRTLNDLAGVMVQSDQCRADHPPPS